MKESTRDEATLLLLEKVLGLTALLVGLYATKYILRPDSTRNLRMSGALFVKRVAQNQADSWQTLANKAATAYHKATL